MTRPPIPPITDKLPISLRAYAAPVKPMTAPSKFKLTKSRVLAASDWTLIFDCETTVDACQRLRFGTYQVRKAGEVRYHGIFYDPDAISEIELINLRNYASLNGTSLLTHTEFVDKIFFRIGYEFRATIVGFNLPFDIARIAIRDNPAKGSMRGGFSFTLSGKYWLPRVRIKHLSSKAAFIEFAASPKQRANRGWQRNGAKGKVRRGHFVDIKTLGCSLFAKPFSLKSLCEFLAVENPKLEFDDFDAPITDEIIEYAVRDTQATWECYERLITRYDALGLSKTRPEQIYSEASIGKAYLKEMNIKSWRECQPDFDPDIIGYIMSSYFGGRSEIRIRRHICQVMLCDFLSMYPTVCTLMGLWRYEIAAGIKTRDATDEALEIVENITLEQLQSKAIWQKLAILVRVKPDADIFPVRTQYGDALQATIGLNYLSSDKPQWFALADCIASKLFTGKTPKIAEAIGFVPKRKQQSLTPIHVNGNSDYAIDPAIDDFYKSLIELRHETKQKIKSSDNAGKQRLDIEQNALKIAANATSYGMFAEMNVEDARSKTEMRVYHSGETPFDMHPSKIEKPGSQFHPLLAALITGAARLMLAITEGLATQKGLDWAFCDTDSMAFAKPDNMDQNEFADKVQKHC